MWGEEMSKIHASVTDQLLKLTVSPTIASGGVNEVKVIFSFSEQWEGFIKTALFYRDTETMYYAVLDDTDTCILPWEVYAEDGTFYMSVFGDKENARRTSTIVRYKVGKGVAAENMVPSEPTPDVYAQIMALIESGILKGDTGEPGYTPVKGVDYWTPEDQEEMYELVSPLIDNVDNTANLAYLKAENALYIAKGRATGYVFDTKADMDLWLTKETNTAKLNLGDNLYIRDTGVPDYWWDGENVQPLETQKVDLAEYVKFTDYANSSTAGVVKSSAPYGVEAASDTGIMRTVRAETGEIDRKAQKYKVITPANLDYAVKSGLANSELTWTDAEKANARKLLGCEETGGGGGESGGSGALPLVYSITLTEPVMTIDLTQIDGKPFSFADWRIIVKLPELFADYVVNAYLHPFGVHKDSKGISFASLANTDGTKLQICVASNVGKYMYEGTYTQYFSNTSYKGITRRYFDFPVVSEAIYLTTWSNDKPLPVGTILEVYGR